VPGQARPGRARPGQCDDGSSVRVGLVQCRASLVPMCSQCGVTCRVAPLRWVLTIAEPLLCVVLAERTYLSTLLGVAGVRRASTSLRRVFGQTLGVVLLLLWLAGSRRTQGMRGLMLNTSTVRCSSVYTEAPLRAYIGALTGHCE
jgi:hypothetical protein